MATKTRKIEREIFIFNRKIIILCDTQPYESKKNLILRADVLPCNEVRIVKKYEENCYKVNWLHVKRGGKRTRVSLIIYFRVSRVLRSIRTIFLWINPI